MPTTTKDGFPDIFVTNDKVPNFLFHNLGNGKFEDVALEMGSAMLDSGASISAMGADFREHDNDGLPDFAVAALAGETFPLFRDGTFEDVSNTVGPDFQVPRAHRGAAFAEFNHDGKIDVVVSALGEPADLWENITPTDNTWLALKLTGTKSNRDGIGAQIRD